MSNWLKTDPDNGMLIGPGGGHFSNEHQAAHYELLHLCGCGNPEEAFNFCQAILACFNRRVEGKVWIDAEDAVKAIILSDPAAAAHVFSHLFNHLKLLEHGSSVGGSWLTENGTIVVDLGPNSEELMDI